MALLKWPLFRGALVCYSLYNDFREVISKTGHHKSPLKKKDISMQKPHWFINLLLDINVGHHNINYTIYPKILYFKIMS